MGVKKISQIFNPKHITWTCSYWKRYSKQILNLQKAYIKPRAYKVRLMQMKEAVDSQYEQEASKWIEGYKGIKVYFLYSQHIGGCTSRIIDIMTDTTYDSKKEYRHVFIPEEGIANQELIKMFADKREVVTSENLGFYTYVMTKYTHLVDDRDYNRYFGRNKEYRVEANKGFLDFTKEQESYGKKRLAEMGLEPGTYACIHARDAAYMQTVLGRSDQECPRNTSIDYLIPAVDYLYSQQITSVRMGQFVSESFDHEGVLDYATIGSERLIDLYLEKHCKCLVASDSGLMVSSTLFAKPKVITNLYTLTMCWGSVPVTEYDVCIPIKMYDEQKKRYLTFEEMLEFEHSDLAKLSETELLQQGIQYVNNTPEEILDATRELMERMHGTYQASEEDEKLQALYLKIRDVYVERYQTKKMRSGGPSLAKMSAKFLRENKELFGDKL
ncbi:MAG: TIGR04372 family glycosyltransferase [Eubacteriales bacterium]